MKTLMPILIGLFCLGLPLAGSETDGIELGTSIVPLYGRHPLVLASQALTVQAALGGRLVLGIGPSHPRLIEHMYGGSYARPYTRTREELEALKALMAGEAIELEGEEVTVRGQMAIEASAPPILLAALGPRMLDLAGREAEGTALWMVGPKTLAEHIAPRIQEAAEGALRAARCEIPAHRPDFPDLGDATRPVPPLACWQVQGGADG